MEGRVFDAQVVLSPTDSPRGKLLSQYVCARITRLDDVDFGLFDWDRHNTLYYFALNADEQIYLRYGGRDPQSPITYLDLESIELALEKGLELHKLYQDGKLPKTERRSSPEISRCWSNAPSAATLASSATWWRITAISTASSTAPSTAFGTCIGRPISAPSASSSTFPKGCW
jgi:hypothetical protein